MVNNPKIKVDADLSSLSTSFHAELAKLKQDIGQIGDLLKSQTGKEQFNFNGSAKELQTLIVQAEKLTAALDRGDKKTKQYAKNLKDAQEAIAQAAKMAAKLEDAGSAKTAKVSGYFRNYAADLAQEHDDVTRDLAQERERADHIAKIAATNKASSARWSKHASRFVGIAGGSVLGGGSTYANIGAFLGSAFGPIASLAGGMIGGTADRNIGGAREEAKGYSELRRSLGSTTTDFEQLRDTVRSVIDGMGIADTEAVNLAKQFAHTASLSGDATDTIARGVHTSSGFAQGYGIAPEQATAFFASLRHSGAANNDKDNRRLAMMIGESVQRGGTSARMDEVLSAISGFVTHAAQQSLTAANAGQYSSYLASLTGSNYAGLKGDPNNAASLMNIMDQGVTNGGTMGEASQFHWLQARQNAFKGMSALDNSLMQTAGATGDLAKLFAPGSASYEAANAEGRARMDRTRQSILDSGFKNNFEVGMAHIKAISHGDSYLENAHFRAMFGGNPQQAAALMLRMKNDPGLGGFEKQLSKYGINLDNVNVSQIASMSELLGGGDKAMAKQYEKLLGSGKLSKAELDSADSIMAKEGYGDNFKKMLLRLTEKYDADDGLKAQTTQIDISNKIQEKVSDLVSIESDVREYILRLVDRFNAGSSVFDRMIAGFKDGSPLSGKSLAGGDWFHGGNNFGGDFYMGRVNNALKDIGIASSQQEKERLYTEFMGKVLKHPENYPAETIDWARAAIGFNSPAGKKAGSTLGKDTDRPTIPASVGPAYAELAKRLMTDNPGLKDFQAAAIVGNLAHESGNFKSLQERNPSSGVGGYGWAQWTGSRRKAFEAYARRHGLSMDSAEANYGFLNEELQGSHSGALQALLKTGNLAQATQVFQDQYESPNASYAHFDRRLEYAADTLDQTPASQRQAQTTSGRSPVFKHQHEITLYDQHRNQLADPIVSTWVSAPLPAGY